MVNKSIGNKCEQALGKLLQSKGYWCHILEYNKNGQPCDIVAIKGDVSMLIDVKHCDKDRFNFSRIEANQKACFEYASSVCGVKNVGFAVYFESDGKFYWLPFERTKNAVRNCALKSTLVEFENIL